MMALSPLIPEKSAVRMPFAEVGGEQHGGDQGAVAAAAPPP
jgi:hypothetical protein